MTATTTTPATTGPIDPMQLVSDLVAQSPARAAVFEQLGIEYCCGGKVPLIDACASRGIAVEEVIAMLEDSTRNASADRDWSTASIEELVADIIETHHAFLHETLPRVGPLAHKVARAHGSRDPRLVEASVVVDLLVEDLAEHLASEEEDVFPVCLEIAEDGKVDEFETEQELHALESEHEQVGAHLARLRELLDGFVPPDGACPTYRAYLDALERLEADVHLHVHKENHILFGKVRDALAD
ncbi:MAG: iron-sulfur cluster repair di-iron protein [Thermoleophilia bacterium]|nr:iron-sulfur cluster repair di-iron protein [Thermoleophilia bacterium]